MAELRSTATGELRPVGRWRHDALVEMARRALAAPADARRPAPLITIVVGDESWRQICELDDGAIITPADVRPYLSQALVETIVFDGARRPVEASHRRTFTGALRQAIRVRDRHCQHASGCDQPMRRCDVDHVVPHSRGGPTDASNGRLLCRYHNRIEPQGTSPPIADVPPDTS
jgi:hypothetical protein